MVWGGVSSSFFLHVDIQFYQHYCCKIFLWPWTFLGSLLKSKKCTRQDSLLDSQTYLIDLYAYSCQFRTLDYYTAHNFVVSFEIRQCESAHLCFVVVLFQLVLVILDFGISIWILGLACQCLRKTRILIEIALTIYQFGSIAMLTILMLPIYKLGLFCHLFKTYILFQWCFVLSGA